MLLKLSVLLIAGISFASSCMAGKVTVKNQSTNAVVLDLIDNDTRITTPLATIKPSDAFEYDFGTKINCFFKLVDAVDENNASFFEEPIDETDNLTYIVTGAPLNELVCEHSKQ